jgi:hypothetical protein
MTKQHHNDANDSVRQEESLSEDELFQKLTTKMEAEVSDMPNIATRRGFFAKNSGNIVCSPGCHSVDGDRHAECRSMLGIYH